MTALNELIASYYAYRKMDLPEAPQAFLFLVSEIGEVADAIVNTQGKWQRKDPTKIRSVANEIGDMMQMLTVTALQMGLDPIECMKGKWKTKGWNENLSANS